MRNRLCVLALLYLALLVACPPAQCLNAFQLGLHYYDHRDYRNALGYFSRAVRQEPGNQLSRYYLANTMAYLHMRQEAAAEYGLCFRINPRSVTAGYCRQAVAKYREKHKDLDLPELPPENATGSGITLTGGYKESQASGASSGDVAQAESLISKEASYEKVKQKMFGETLAKNATATAESQAIRIRAQAEGDAEAALRPPTHGCWNPQQAQAMADQIRRNAQEAAAEARAAADNKGLQFRDWSNQRQKAIDEVVANLHKELENPRGHDGVKLQALGTDLYVRFYGYERSSPVMPEVHPVSIRIVGRDDVPLVGDLATQQRLHAPPDQVHTERSVKGKLLEKQ